MDLGLGGAAAAVVGGSKGMGRATAECLAAEGARVAVLARGREALEDTVEALRASGSPDALGISTDTQDRAQVEAAFKELDERWGALNVLVNTPGAPAGKLEDLSDEDWHTTFDRATLGAVRCVRAALPLMRKAEWARIVNVSAHSTRRQSPLIVAYTAAKSALTSFSKNLAKSLAPEGILVNTVSPGTFVTASFTERLRPVLAEQGYDAADPHDVMEWIKEVYGQPADLGRAGLPEEIAVVITFLASRRNTYCTGADVNVDGGSDFF
jgi:NAD(P)-dependent dehydrogenase (short-subunit alcohol dehydrogenase family)